MDEVYFEERLYVQEVAAAVADGRVLVYLGTTPTRFGQPANNSHAVFACPCTKAPRVGDEIRVVVGR